MRRVPTAVLAAMLGGAALFGGVAIAQSAGDDNRDVPVEPTNGDLQNEPTGDSGSPVSPRAFSSDTQILTIPAAAFTADGANPDSLFFPFGGGYFRGTSANYGCLVAPVNLPHGSKITRLEVASWDADTTINQSMTFRRVSNFPSTELLASTSTSGNTSAVQVTTDTTINSDIVDNVDWTYYLATCLQSVNIRLYSARIFYQEELVVDPHSPIVVPVTPFRAYDSRFVDGPLGEGENRLVSVRRSIDIETGAVIKNNAIPAGATAIMFNLAVTNTIGGGFVAATPGGATEFSTASINWSASGQTVNNGTFVELDGNRRVRAFVGGTPGAGTDFIIDVTGYIIPGS